jgi:phosphoenolpyruvate-protein kinase (PTS system EI component)
MTEHLVLAGRPAAGGVATGRLSRVDTRAPSIDARTGEPAVRLREAFDAVAADLDRLVDQLRDAGTAEPAEIVATVRLIALDPDLRADAERLVDAGAAPAAAVAEAAERHAAILAALPDATLAGRAADVRAVGRRLVNHLTGGGGGLTAAHDGPLVVAAYEVTADDLLKAGERLVGAVSSLGGPNAHAAIVARALGVPLVVGLDAATLERIDGTEVVVNGSGGTVVAAPEPAERQAALDAMRAQRQRREALAAQRFRPCETVDGLAVTVLANVGSAIEADLARAADAEGIGVLRTEMAFLGGEHWPTLDEQVAALLPILQRFAGTPVTIRTFDFATDKQPRFVPDGKPRPDALAEQFRAILAAARTAAGADSRLSVMLPMVNSASEFVRARALLAQAAADAGWSAPPPLGAMVESADAVADIEAIAAAADFLSIGTNDLTAGILGLDRRDPALTPARAAEPAVLRAVSTVASTGSAARIPVSVCGDAAADPSVVPLLIGAGISRLSVAPAALDEVRALVRSLAAVDCDQQVTLAFESD